MCHVFCKVVCGTVKAGNDWSERYGWFVCLGKAIEDWSASWIWGTKKFCSVGVDVMFE